MKSVDKIITSIERATPQLIAELTGAKDIIPEGHKDRTNHLGRSSNELLGMLQHMANPENNPRLGSQLDN
jgi:hypothetical protein